MMATARIDAAYARDLREPVLVRRFTGIGANRPHHDVTARGKATPFSAGELIGGILQGDQKVIVLASDLVGTGFRLPVLATDRVVVRGVELRIINPSARKAPDGTVVAYELQCRGGGG